MPRGADAADLLLERDAELAAIAAARADVLAGRGAAVLVCGPVGIGRTALLERAVADSGMASLTARGVELERGFAFGTALRLLRPAPGGEEPTAELGPGPLRELLLHGRPPTDEEHPTVVHGLVRLLAVRAARSPLLVAVDDLQACDEATVELLGALAQARPPGLLLLLAVRDGDGAPGPGSATVAAVAGVRRLPLRPLGETAVARLAGPQRAGGLHRHTGGNPLFLTELLRDGGTADAGAPASIVRLMARRLDGLSAQAREIAGALAVLNGSADPALLRHTSDLPASAVQDGLTELARAGIADPQDCTFRHAVVRDAVLAGLPLPRRAALHVRAARRLGEARPRTAAAHLVQADAHEDARSAWAADVLLRAADEAGAGSGERRRCLRRALACTIDPPTRSRARAALGLALAQHHDPEGVTELEHARELARAGRPAAEVAVELAEALFHLARMEDSARTCREALATLDAADDTHRELRLRLEAGALAAEAAGGTVRRPVVPAELRDGPARTLGERAVLSRLAWTLATMGTVPAGEVRALARRAMDGTRLLDDAGPSSPAFVYAASALVIAGDPSTVVALTTEAARRAHAAHAPVGVTYALALRGQAHVAQERLLAAAADAQTALDGLHAADLPAQAVAMAWRLETAIDLDDARGAAEDLRAAALEGELPDLGPVHLLLLARAGLHAAQGADDRALGDLVQLRDRVGPRYANPSSLCWKPRLAEVLVRTGERAAARDTIEPAVERAESFGVARALGQCLRVRGLVRGGADGEDDLRRAAVVLGEGAAPVELARTLLDLGEARHAAGDPEGRALLRQALQEAHGAGASAVVDDAMRRLRAAGARPRRPRVPGTHTLRPQRRLVIELAAEGLDDEAIGDRLFLRPETVAEHVRLGLDALRVPSRRALIALHPADPAA